MKQHARIPGTVGVFTVERIEIWSDWTNPTNWWRTLDCSRNEPISATSSCNQSGFDLLPPNSNDYISISKQCVGHRYDDHFCHSLPSSGPLHFSLFYALSPLAPSSLFLASLSLSSTLLRFSASLRAPSSRNYESLYTAGSPDYFLLELSAGKGPAGRSQMRKWRLEVARTRTVPSWPPDD